MAGQAQLPKQLQWDLPATRQAQVQVAPWQDGHYLRQLPVAASSTSRKLPSEIGLLWDGSGSAGQRDHTREFALLDRYFAALRDGTVALTVLRDRAEPVRRFRIRAGNWSELRAALQAVLPDGASALAQWQPQPGVKEYLLVSDGLLTYGPEQLPAMAPDQRLFAVSRVRARMPCDCVVGVRRMAVASSRWARMSMRRRTRCWRRRWMCRSMRDAACRM